MSSIRIESIRKAILNGRSVKIFKAFRKEGDSFVFIGEYSAPVRTANKNLADFII